MHSRADEVISDFKAAIDANMSLDAIDAFDAYIEFVGGKENKGKGKIHLESPVFPQGKTALEYAASVGNIDIVNLLVIRKETSQENIKKALEIIKRINSEESDMPAHKKQTFSAMNQALRENLKSDNVKGPAKLKNSETSRISSIINAVQMSNTMSRVEKKDKVKSSLIKALKELKDENSAENFIHKAFDFLDKNEKQINKFADFKNLIGKEILSKIAEEYPKNENPVNQLKLLNYALGKFRDIRETDEISETNNSVSITRFDINHRKNEIIRNIPNGKELLAVIEELSKNCSRDNKLENMIALPKLMDHLERSFEAMKDQPALLVYLISDIEDRLRIIDDPMLKNAITERLIVIDKATGLNLLPESGKGNENRSRASSAVISAPAPGNLDADRKATIDLTRQAMTDLMAMQKLIDKIGSPEHRTSDLKQQIEEKKVEFEIKFERLLTGDSPITKHYEDQKNEYQGLLDTAAKMKNTSIDHNQKVRPASTSSAAQMEAASVRNIFKNRP